MNEHHRPRSLARMTAAMAIALALGVPAAPAQASGREVVVSMSNMKFGTIPADLKVGDSIVWVNKDSVPHTVTARNRGFDLRIGPGRRGRLNLTNAGTVPIYCSLHPAMRGSLSVAPR